jgi:P4 family phage/plasmid primase-like protien
VSATKLWEAGYADLVSVIPPGAELSANSAIDPKMLGKVPGKRGQDGKWFGYSFTRETPSRELAETIDRTGANVGLLGDRFPALDIDVDSVALCRAVVGLAAEILGYAPVRSSRGPRRLLVFRADESFTRMALVVTHKGKSHLIEMLGKGRQYLVHGMHPKGRPYGWIDMPLWEWQPSELTLITRNDVILFFDTLQDRLTAKGLECERIGDGATREAKAPPQENLQAPSIAELRALVAKIPNTAPDRDSYILFGNAIKAAGAADEGAAFDIFADWADRWDAGTNEPETVEADWSRMHAPHRVGWSWLVEQAEKAGAVNTAQDDFDADIDPAPKPPERNVTFSDEWAVSRILPEVEGKLRYVPSTKEWYVWDVHRWRRDDGMLAEITVREKLRPLALWLHDAAEQAVGKEAGPYSRAATRYQNENGINAVFKLLRARVACGPTGFDASPFLLNTPGGVVDLKTGAVTPSDPALMLSRSVTVAPARGAMPLWRQFMGDLTGGDTALERFVQKMCGYALTGDISEKSLWFVWGSDSDTGKSTFIRALSLLFGDYADSVDIDAFVGAKERIPADLARLPGVRLVTAAEPAAGQSWDERRIKAITGGDEISARYLYGQWFTFVPQFKIVIVGNHPPEIKTVDDAMLRRLHVVPFNRKVPREKQIDNLAKRLIDEEGPAILHWLIEGCVAWSHEGLTPPPAVLQQTGEYVDEEDTLQQWLEEECELGKAYEAARQDLYQAWSAWCRSRREDPGGAKAFKRKIDRKKKMLRIEETRIGNRRLNGYIGLRLRLKTEEGTEEFVA